MKPLLALLLLLATSAPAEAANAYAGLITASVPNDFQVTNYSRVVRSHTWSAFPITTKWVVVLRKTAIPAGTELAVFSGETAVSAWVPAVAGTFTAPIPGPLPDGPVCLEPRIRTPAGTPTPDYWPLPLVGHIAVKGPTLGAGKIALAPTRFELEKGHILGKHGCSWIDYPGAQPAPTGYPLTTFPAVKPWGTDFSAANLQAINLGPHGHMVNRFMQLPSGAVQRGIITAYFEYDLKTNRVPLLDGGRGRATLGHAIKCEWHEDGSGVYCLGLNNRIFTISLANEVVRGKQRYFGDVDTHAGWRVIPGAVTPAWWLHSSTSQPERAWYQSRIETVGDWVGSPGFLRPWGMTADRTVKDPARPEVDGRSHFLYIDDTFRHVVRTFNHLPAHEPGGRAQVRVWYGALDTPGQNIYREGWVKGIWTRWVHQAGVGPLALTQPWDSDFCADNAWLYVADHGADRIVRIHKATKELQVVVASGAAVRPYLNDAGSGGIDDDIEYKRLGLGTGYLATQAYRTRFVTDGPAGTATITRPQSLVCHPTSGHIYWSERWSGLIRRYDPVSKLVVTVGAVPKYSYGKHVTFQMDKHGTVGPVGDMLGGAFTVQSDFRISATPGKPVLRMLPTKPERTTHQGMLTYAGSTPSYPWMAAPGPMTKPCLLTNDNALYRTELICRPVTAPPPPDLARYRRGMLAWNSSHGPVASLAVTNGHGGISTVGLPGFYEVAKMDAPSLAAFCAKAGITNSVECGDLRYTAQWEAQW